MLSAKIYDRATGELLGDFHTECDPSGLFEKVLACRHYLQTLKKNIKTVWETADTVSVEEENEILVWMSKRACETDEDRVVLNHWPTRTEESEAS
jgi:hypothetical protein